jgi:nucleoside-diphosphate-sugar epimerase
MRIAITGGDGFIGKELKKILRERGHEVLGFGRASSGGSPSLWDKAGWSTALAGVEAVVHLAGRAHVTSETAADPLGEFRRVNVDGTLCVASAAISAGVRRFVFVSSIGVLGNVTDAKPFSESSVPRPTEPYAVSKYEAELALQALQSNDNLQLVVVRPPLVYGPGAKGNFLRLMKLVQWGMPLPLRSVDNRRSFVGVTNLCELLMLCAEREVDLRHRLFVASDGDASTPQLLALLARHMQRPCRVFSFPTMALEALATVGGFRSAYRSLTGNLQVDSQQARVVLGWKASKSFEQGIKEMVDSFAEVSA